MTIDSTMLVQLIAVLVAVVAGAFSLLNVVSTKETKVSEHRLAWINELRGEVANFTSAIHEASRLYAINNQFTAVDLFKESQESWKVALESLTKIQLRLNPNELSNKKSKEAILMSAIQAARDAFDNDRFTDMWARCDDIRNAAAQLLKVEWDRVKGGEILYRVIRNLSVFALVAVACAVSYIALTFKLDSAVKPLQIEITGQPLGLHAKIEVDHPSSCEGASQLVHQLLQEPNPKPKPKPKPKTICN
jgi:hypothetical protein